MHGHVENANVHGARYFGIVNNGAHVEVEDFTVSDIGEKPFNGTQHGVAIYWAIGSSAKGSIHGNYIWNYQKGGIVVNGANSSADITEEHRHRPRPGEFHRAKRHPGRIRRRHRDQARIPWSATPIRAPASRRAAASSLVGGDCYGGAATTNTRIQGNTGLGNDVGRLLLQSRQRVQSR